MNDMIPDDIAKDARVKDAITLPSPWPAVLAAGSLSVEKCDPDISPLGHARQVIKIKQGLEAAVAKQVTTFIRDTKLKVTTQIQDNQIRVTGKSRDDLQSVIASVRGHDFLERPHGGIRRAGHERPGCHLASWKTRPSAWRRPERSTLTP